MQEETFELMHSGEQISPSFGYRATQMKVIKWQIMQQKQLHTQTIASAS